MVSTNCSPASPPCPAANASPRRCSRCWNAIRRPTSARPARWCTRWRAKPATAALLAASLERQPTELTAWMANRLLNSKLPRDDRNAWLQRLTAVTSHPEGRARRARLGDPLPRFPGQPPGHRGLNRRLSRAAPSRRSPRRAPAADAVCAASSAAAAARTSSGFHAFQSAVPSRSPMRFITHHSANGCGSVRSRFAPEENIASRSACDVVRERQLGELGAVFEIGLAQLRKARIVGEVLRLVIEQADAVALAGQVPARHHHHQPVRSSPSRPCARRRRCPRRPSRGWRSRPASRPRRPPCRPAARRPRAASPGPSTAGIRAAAR